jgi:hypothetical protein
VGRGGCRSRRSSCGSLHCQIPHEARLPSSSVGGAPQTRVRSAALCLVPLRTTKSIDGAGSTTVRWPPPRAYFDGRCLSRSRASVESRTASRPLSLTIPIACGGAATRLRPTGFIRTEPALVLRRSSWQCG